MALSELVRDETEGFPGQIRMQVDDGIRLPASRARDFALIIHELVTNSTKYGALKTKEGSILVAAQRADGCKVRFSWEERGGPPVETPSRQGFGLALLDMVARGMSGDVDGAFRAGRTALRDDRGGGAGASCGGVLGIHPIGD